MPAPLIDYMSIKETNDVAEAWDEYKSIFENSLVGIVRTEISTGKILRLNSRAAEMYGYRSPDEVIGRFTKEFFPIPSERKALAEMLAHKGEVSNYQLQLRRKDGSTYWIAFYTKVNPKEGVFDSIAVDINYPRLQKHASKSFTTFSPIIFAIKSRLSRVRLNYTRSFALTPMTMRNNCGID